MKKPIIAHFFTTLNPSLFLSSLNYILNPFMWGNIVNWKSSQKLKKVVWEYFWIKENNIELYYNARSTIYHWLRLLRIWAGDEVIVQGYTCISVPNAIIQSGAIPIYADIDNNSLNIDIESVKLNITSNTKAIIVQHTFGNPVDMEELVQICREKNIYLIEDSAHSLGGEYKWKKLWTIWDIWIFSTGRDKVISTVTWGIMLVNNEKLLKDREFKEEKLYDIPVSLAIKNLIYNLSGYLAYKTYYFFSLGKVIIYLSRRFNLITEILSSRELECKDKSFYYRLPNCLADLWIKEFSKLDIYNAHRIWIAKLYDIHLKDIEWIKILKSKDNEKNIYFWYPIITNRALELKKYCKEKWILLGNYWSWQNIIPKSVNLIDAVYKLWTCPKSEKISKQVLTLPTHYDIWYDDAEKVIECVKEFIWKQ